MCTQACSVGCTYSLKGFADYYVRENDIEKGVSNKICMCRYLYICIYYAWNCNLRCCLAKNKNTCSGVVSAQSFGMVVLCKPPSVVCDHIGQLNWFRHAIANTHSHSLIHLLTHSVTRSTNHLVIHQSPMHLLTHSPTHPLTHSQEVNHVDRDLSQGPTGYWAGLDKHSYPDSMQARKNVNCINDRLALARLPPPRTCPLPLTLTLTRSDTPPSPPSPSHARR